MTNPKENDRENLVREHLEFERRMYERRLSWYKRLERAGLAEKLDNGAIMLNDDYEGYRAANRPDL